MVSSFAAVFALAGIPALIQLTLGWPQARPTRNLERRLVVGTWILSPGRESPGSWLGPVCRPRVCAGLRADPLAIHPDARAARTLIDLTLLFTVVAGVVAAAVTVRPSRFWPGGIAVLVLAVEAAVRLQGRGLVPEAVAIPLYQARCASLSVVGVALVAAAVRRIRRRHRLVRLAASLDAAPAPGTYAASLAEVVGDPSLDIGYATVGQDRYVHANGQPFPGPQDHQVATRLERNGTPVAMVVHQPEDAEAIATGLGAAAGWLSTTSGCRPTCAASWPTFGPVVSGSWNVPTPSVCDWSGTCTTAPSRGSSCSATNCAGRCTTIPPRSPGWVR